MKIIKKILNFFKPVHQPEDYDFLQFVREFDLGLEQGANDYLNLGHQRFTEPTSTFAEGYLTGWNEQKWFEEAETFWEQY